MTSSGVFGGRIRGERYSFSKGRRTGDRSNGFCKIGLRSTDSKGNLSTLEAAGTLAAAGGSTLPGFSTSVEGGCSFGRAGMAEDCSFGGGTVTVREGSFPMIDFILISGMGTKYPEFPMGARVWPGFTSRALCGCASPRLRGCAADSKRHGRPRQNPTTSTATASALVTHTLRKRKGIFERWAVRALMGCYL